MNAKITFFTVFTGFLLLLAGCHKDDDIPGGIEPTEPIIKAFDEKYPYGKDAQWKIAHNFYVVEFNNPLISTVAWFTETGTWMMDETDLPIREIPSPITSAIQQSKYASWTMEEADILNRRGMAYIYKVEVKKEKKETDLYYSQCGNLIKTVEEAAHYEDEPIFIPEKVTHLMESTFSNAALLYMEENPTGVTLYLLEGTTYKIAELSKQYTWKSTTWEVKEQEVPALILEKFRASAYGNDPIRSIWELENIDGDFHLFHVLHNGQETTVKLNVFGNIV